MKKLILAGVLALSEPAFGQDMPFFDSALADNQFNAKCLLNGQSRPACTCFAQAVNNVMKNPIEKQVIYLYILGDYPAAQQLRAQLRDQLGYKQRQDRVDVASKPCLSLARH